MYPELPLSKPPNMPPEFDGHTWKTLLQAGHDAYDRRLFDQAEQLYDQALSGAESEHDRTRSVPMCLLYMADLYEREGKYEKAAELLNRVLNIYRITHGSDSLSVALTMRKLADVRGAQGNLDEALELQTLSDAIMSHQLTPSRIIAPIRRRRRRRPVSL